MRGDGIFISYSQHDTVYKNELYAMLSTVTSLRERLWVDTQGLRSGDRLDPTIQQALEESSLGILLLSEHFFLSDYIQRQELPYMVSHLTLVPLYVTTLPPDALQRTVSYHGKDYPLTLTDHLGPHGPREPLDTLDASHRKAIYARLATQLQERRTHHQEPLDALDASQRRAIQLHEQPTRTAVTTTRPDAPRYELAITLRARRGGWEHHFALPSAARLPVRPLDCPSPAQILGTPGHLLPGDELLQLLLGREPRLRGQILGAAFGNIPAAEPPRAPLRIHLLTDEAGLWSLPWGRLSYDGRPLVAEGWSVELHPTTAPGFPEYPPHTCYVPGKIVLVVSGAGHLQATRHSTDLLHFFQRRWPQGPEPLLVQTHAALRAVLRTGSTRLLYYYGPASAAGLLLEENAPAFPWEELADLLQRPRPASAVWLNLLGDSSVNAVASAHHLLAGAMAVLVQCNADIYAHQAAQAAGQWLHSALAADARERLDPVVALHQHQHGHIAAWTRYATWQPITPSVVEMPELVDLLLDRSRQRADILQAKADFYIYTDRRIYQTVALGTAGCRVAEFPATAALDLRLRAQEREVIRHRPLLLPGPLTQVPQVEDLVARTYGLASRQSVLKAILRQDTIPGQDFWFLVLGWQLQAPLADVQTGVTLVTTIADWCRMRLLPEVMSHTPAANIRVLSIVAIETTSLEVAETLAERLADLSETLNTEDSFHLGRLDRLSGVDRQDLRNYFQNRQICLCPEEYRRDFPSALLQGHSEMSFDAAVTTIKRGEPDHWGDLLDTLQDLAAAGHWPPQGDVRAFWEAYDGR